MEELIRASTLTGYFQVAQKYRLNPLLLLQQAGINPAVIGDPSQRIRASAAFSLLEISARAAGCETFGLEMADLRSRRDVGPIGLLLAHARTLREALLTAERYRHLLNDALGLYIDQQGSVVTIREELLAGVTQPSRQATELAIGVLVRICRALLGSSWHPRTVCFSHAAPAERRAHQRFFACPVSFGAEFNGIVCDATDLDAANPAADPVLLRYVESLSVPQSQLDPQSLVADVRRCIYMLLPQGETGVEQVAGQLHLSVRTLQRQLQALEQDFSTLLSDVRAELVVRYLANPRFPLGRIAVLLGYSRQASFTRWFTARFAMSPKAWRQQSMRGGECDGGSFCGVDQSGKGD